MQILAGTFKEVADKDWSIDDPVQNARAGIRYLKKLDKQSGGVPELTAAGYYGGPGGLEKARRGVAVSDPKNPNAPDTLRYGREVVARMGGAPSGGGHVRGAALAATAPLPAAGAPTVLAENQVPSEPGPVPLPPEVMAALTRQAPAMVEPGQDPWGAFLKGMPQARKPVAPEDLVFGTSPAMAAVPTFRTQPMENRRPNFEAFSSWKGRVA
jgi:hypothetical protein